MKKLILVILPLLLISCINENPLHPVFPIQMLHGNSAKVWVFSESSSPNDKHLSALKEYRKCYVFYSNGSFREQTFIHLGSDEGDIGEYKITEDRNGKTTLHLYYNNTDDESFTIKSISNNSLTLLTTKEAYNTWEFKSLKPPKL